MSTVTIALAQTPVGADVTCNARHIKAMMRKAKAAGADLVQVTEGALSGYGRKVLTPFEQWQANDWAQLRHESRAIASLAGELRLWVLVGSVHPLENGGRPHNCLYLIGPDGTLRTRYDKRFCSRNELTGWYIPGAEPVVFEINGVRFGFAICLEVRFPEVFDEYRRLGVHGVLVSTFTAARNDAEDAKQDNIFAVTAQAHAANNCYWVSLVTPSNPFQGPVTQLIDPLGNVVAKSSRHRSDLVLGRIEIGERSLWHKIAWGRAWRDSARSGEIYRERRIDTPRSRDRQSF
ncbi:carbon-nitrogen hydrolase family protein [Dongia deserti]|uniref:carbon-nitrogen hydrolase family protein n=1 Tax=Dongia deserti TaxID=2268030 RepID=UPI0013C521BE|nr:carbon-nitrogen hydrolase family protein [Dongia deserti]